MTENETMKSTTSINTDAILINIRAFLESPSPIDFPTHEIVPTDPPNGTIKSTIYALRAIIYAPVASTPILLATNANISRLPQSKHSIAELGIPILR